jgi:hypothetical protein
VLYLHLVAIYELASEVTIDLVEVQTMITSDEGLYEFDVLTHLVDVTGTTRIVSCGLNTTTEGLVALETYDVVCLPAVQ